VKKENGNLNLQKMLHVDKMVYVLAGKYGDLAVWSDNPLLFMQNLLYTMVDSISTDKRSELRKQVAVERLRIMRKNDY